MNLNLDTALVRLLNIFKTGSAGTPTPVLPEAALTELLSYAVASTSHPGIAELATSAEAVAGADAARAVTPAALTAALENLKLMTFAGAAAAGPCTAAGLAVGDTIVGVVGLTAGALGDASSSFEPAVTVADQIQQSAESDLHANTYLALVRPA
jgi:predicted metalloprotease with PDZ domain